MYPKQFEKLVECLRNLPGVGLKTAERYAFQILEWDEDKINEFIDCLTHIKEGSLKHCQICGNLAEDENVRYVKIIQEMILLSAWYRVLKMLSPWKRQESIQVFIMYLTESYLHQKVYYLMILILLPY